MYTSGRTVKSSKRVKPTTRVTATADARKLVNRYLPGIEGVTIDSTLTAAPVTLAAQVRTMITFPAGLTDAHVALAVAITELSGYVGAINDDCSITYLRTI
jgi:hypothetical protein